MANGLDGYPVGPRAVGEDEKGVNRELEIKGLGKEENSKEICMKPQK